MSEQSVAAQEASESQQIIDGMQARLPWLDKLEESTEQELCAEYWQLCILASQLHQQYAHTRANWEWKRHQAAEALAASRNQRLTPLKKKTVDITMAMALMGEVQDAEKAMISMRSEINVFVDRLRALQSAAVRAIAALPNSAMVIAQMRRTFEYLNNVNASVSQHVP
jgi:hypothetical protein